MRDGVFDWLVVVPLLAVCIFFRFVFFNDTATTEIYTLSLHDALPIYLGVRRPAAAGRHARSAARRTLGARSEEHTSELQSHHDLVCRLLLEKKKTITPRPSAACITWTAATCTAGTSTTSPLRPPCCLT